MKPVRTPEELGAALAAAREHTGMTKAAVGEALGTTGQRIGDYERGTFTANGRTLMRHLELLGCQLAIVPKIESGPETALSASVAAETPSPGVRGCAEGPQGESGASEAVAPEDLADVLAVVDGPAIRDATVPLDGDSNGGWNWTPTTDGGHYSGPHGPDICPRVGCRHEGGAA